MATTRPGNHDRGWNDPPVFLHNNSNSANSNNRVSTPPRRTLLNRRVAYPIHASKSDPVLNPCPPGLPSSGSTSSFLIPTASNSTSPSPVLFMMGAGTTSADPITQNHEVKPPGLSLDQLNEQVASDFNIEDDKEFLARVSSKILSFLEDCSHLQTRVRDDIKKKLEIFTDFWISGKICQVVKLKMALLSQGWSVDGRC
ncbi:steroid receptor RNA activator 1-like isoform X2 [Tubulanus polymorphus]|uniref:steroid receptor RNA activator 1-like isoform X2 n=1 Tax=Tubulanus polymorphus TaxID=672921 RepID=UPI003DA3B4E4